MDSEQSRPVVLALLAVVTIALAAATLNTAVVTDESGGFGPGSPGSDPGAENGSQPDLDFGDDTDDATGSSMTPPCYPVLDTWWAILLFLGGFLLGAGVAHRRLGGLGVLALVGPIGVPVLFAHALLTRCTDPVGDAAESLFRSGNVTVMPEGGSGAPGSGTGTSVTEPSTLLLLGLGVALMAAVALLVHASSGDDPAAGDDAEESTEPEDVAAIGRAAGEAADRIESDAELDNEIYRAWREMTAHLDVARPESSTPAEFADAAVAAGMAREDVEELTGLFEAVRYGGASPTDERERRAVSALRRIEREYAGRQSGETDAGRRSDGADPGRQSGGGDPR